MTDMQKKIPFKFIISTGLSVAILVLGAASLNAYISSGVSPTIVLQFIASGAFGKEAFAGGLPMVLWGAFFHLFISMWWVFLFYFIYPRISFLSKNKMAAGAAYGFFIWLVMTFVVLQLANTPKQVFDIKNAVVDMAICVATAGLPVSILVSKRYLKRITNP